MQNISFHSTCSTLIAQLAVAGPGGSSMPAAG